MINSKPDILSPEINSTLNTTRKIIREKGKYGHLQYDACPNCGNTKPVFYQFRNGMMVCFICRKASPPKTNPVQAY